MKVVTVITSWYTGVNEGDSDRWARCSVQNMYVTKIACTKETLKHRIWNYAVSKVEGVSGWEGWTYFLLIWKRKSSKLTLTFPLKRAKDGRFSYFACRRSSIRISSEAIREVTPSNVDSRERLKTPGKFDDIVICSLSNWRGEYWSMDNRIPRSYNFLAEYRNDPNCGAWPVLWRSRRWAHCLLKGRTERFFLQDRRIVKAILN